MSRQSPWWLPTGMATTGMVISALPMFSVAALAPFLVTDLGLARSAIGAVVTSSFVVASSASLVAGHLVDRLGARRGLAVLCVTISAGVLAASVSGSVAALAVALAVAGVGQSLANPATNVLITDAVPTQRRGLAIGIKQSGIQIGALGTGLLLPLVAELTGWRWAMRSTLLLAVLLLVTLWWTAGAGLAPPTRDRTRTARWTLPRGWLAWLVVYSLLLGTGLSSVNTYLPLYAVQSLGFTASTAGLLLAAFGATGVAARVGWGRWADRLSDLSVPLAWFSVAAVGGVGLIIGAGLWFDGLVWLGAVVVGSSATAANALSMLAVVRRGGATGHASGLVSLGFFGGFVFGPSSFGLLSDRAGYFLAWPVVAAVFAGSVLLALGVRRAAAAPADG